MQGNKVASYLGLARRAGKLTLGVQAAASAKDVFLLVADETVAENNRKEIGKLGKRFSCPIVYIAGLEDITGKANCKLAAVREEHLAAAILKYSEIE